VRMSLTSLPHVEGFASHLAAMQMVDGPETLEQLEQNTGWNESHQLSPLQCLKSLDDLDEEEADDDADPDDEEDEDDLDEDYDEDEDEGDEDEDEDDEEEDEDEDDVKPLKMSSARSRPSRL
jgi:hypothetical protein